MIRDGAFLYMLFARSAAAVASHPEWPSAFTNRQSIFRDPLTNPEPRPKEIS